MSNPRSPLQVFYLNSLWECFLFIVYEKVKLFQHYLIAQLFLGIFAPGCKPEDSI